MQAIKVRGFQFLLLPLPAPHEIQLCSSSAADGEDLMGLDCISAEDLPQLFTWALYYLGEFQPLATVICDLSIF